MEHNCLYPDFGCCSSFVVNLSVNMLNAISFTAFTPCQAQKSCGNAQLPVGNRAEQAAIQGALQNLSWMRLGESQVSPMLVPLQEGSGT